MHSSGKGAAEILTERTSLTTTLCAALVSLMGFAVLAGWLFNIEILKSVLPGLVTMKANTAIGFVLSGLSMISLVSGGKDKARRNISLLMASLVLLLGSATVCEYIFNINLGIDQIFFKESLGATGTLDLGRMAPTTALCFIAIGGSLTLLNITKAVTTAQILAYLVWFLGLASLLGYTYGIKELYGIGKYTQMAVHTAVTFILLGVGAFMAKKNRSIAGILLGNGLGSISARHILPMAFILPFVIAYLRIQGERLGLYSSDLGVGLVALSYMLIFSTAIIWSAKVINKADKERGDSLAVLRETSKKLQVSTDEWKRTFDSISEMIFIIDKDNNITSANKAFVDVIKKPIDWILSKKCYEIMHGRDRPWPECPLEKTIIRGW